MINKRKQFIHWLFKATQKVYTRFKKKQPWNITNEQLLDMPVNSYGYHLGCFLHTHNFQLIDKVERHDAYHVLTGFGTRAEDEIALQYVCFGNGKRTPYLIAVLLIGTLILPEYLSYYRKSYSFGKKANSFHQFDFKTLLPMDFKLFRGTIFSATILKELHELQHPSTLETLKSKGL
jgi:ubiquinone biosynthesis protein Coq4